MAFDALNFGGLDGTNANLRYYSVAMPALPDADWCIGCWTRYNVGAAVNPVPRAWSSAVDAGVGVGLDALINNYSSVDHLAVRWRLTGAAAASSMDISLPAFIGQDALVVIQRRGTLIELYSAPKGSTVSAYGNSGAVGGTTVGASTWNIGRFVADTSKCWANPLGEFFLLSSDSLTFAEITTLAAGAHITKVRNSPVVDLRFRAVNATEPNRGTGGASNDATLVGAGFGQDAEFFPDAADGGAPLFGMPTIEQMLDGQLSNTALRYVTAWF